MELQKIYCENCLDTLKRMPDGFIDNCITSPPYYGLRDYGNDDQIGLEETPEQYVRKLVEIFHEVKRAMKDDGTLWLNLGDSYAASGGKQVEQTVRGGNDYVNAGQNNGNRSVKNNPPGIKMKDLLGIPWMVAFALRADGWYLRQDIIWSKPNPMPESVTDRCTKAHEYIFLLSKSARYYYDADAIKTPIADASIQRLNQNIDGQIVSDRVPGKTNGNMKAVRAHGIVRDRLLDYDSKEKELRNKVERGGFERESQIPLPEATANKKSVWTVTTKPFKEAHFAVYPEKLIEPCVLTTKKDAIIYDPFGGAGTTAAGLSAGIPSIIVPFHGDQPFWGHLIAKLGVGPNPIPRKKLSVTRLAKAIQEVETNIEISERAAKLGSEIREENGIESAVSIINEIL